MKGEKKGPPSTQVIIAALNEQEGIGLTIAELKYYLGNSRVLVIDGRSTDKTAEIAKKIGSEVVFQDGSGKGDALSKAIKYLNQTIEYVVITDADYTYPAEHLPQMIQILEENPNVGMVCGNRFNHHLEVSGLQDVFYFGNRFIAFAHNMLNGVPLRDPLTGLRVVRTKILTGWQVKSKGFDVEVELNHLVERKGFSIKEIDIGYRPRLGQKKLGIRHSAEILKRIMLETIY